MKVLVTGGAGYLGSVLVRELLAGGYRVVCLDRLIFGGDPLEDVASDPNLQVVRGDTLSFDPSILRGVSAVIDLAAIAAPDPEGKLSPELFYQVNCMGPLRVATLSKKHGVERYIFSSTCGVYGFQEGVLDERSPLNPAEIYGRTKAQAERLVLETSDERFCVTVLRLATLYGLSPRMRFDLVVNGMTLSLFKTGRIRVKRDGTQWRPLVHVRDAAAAFLRVLEAERGDVAGEVFNVGSNDQNFQIYQLAKLVGDSVGVSYEIEWYGEPDNRSYRVDFSKIRRTLGYGTRFTVRDGAVEIYNALKEGRVRDVPQAYVIDWYSSL